MTIFYGRSDDSKKLKNFANTIGNRPDLELYKEYCLLREQGLRKKTIESLQAFIEQAKDWPLAKRIEFVDMVMHQAGYSGDILTPQPLVQGLILPAVKEWIAASPQEAAPRRWLGIITSDCVPLQEAIEIDPAEQIARLKLIDFLTGDVEYSVHELPSGYSGNPWEDLAVLEQADELMAGITNAKLKEYYAAELKELRDEIQNYLANRD